MAFATSNVQTNYFGSLNVTTGDWTGSVGDAPGTLSVKGGRVWFAFFADQDGVPPAQPRVVYKTASSGAVTTITVYNNQPVTIGRFLVISG